MKTLTAAATCIALLGVQSALDAEQRLKIRVWDKDTGQPVPCRLHLKDPAGKAVRAPGLPFWHDHFVCDGNVDLALPAGAYRYEIERGPEYYAVTNSMELREGESQTATHVLTRLTDLKSEGWWSGETHVHRAVDDLQLLMKAEDLYVAHDLTWWNQKNPWLEQPLPSPIVTVFNGLRFVHAVGGEDERGGGALLYLNLQTPLNITGSKREFPSSQKFLKQARAETGVHVDIEKPFWWDVPLWLASGMVDSIGIAHNHMNRGGMLDNEAWGRARDRARYPGPHGNGFYTQEIYYHVLNSSLRISPSAGSASGVLPNPVGYNRAYVYCGDEFTWQQWHQNLRAGRVFVSNGPLLRCRANGQWPGHVFRSEGPFQVRLEAILESRDPISAVEVVKNGQTSKISLPASLSFSDSGWFLVRAIAEVTNTFRFASTGPWYVEVGNKPMRPARESAKYFLDWSRERMATLLTTTNLLASQRDEVLAPWREAEKFWQEKLSNADSGR